MTTYSDTFAGSGNLGMVEVGGVAWQVINGTWSRSGGYAATSTDRAYNPIAAIQANTGDVDVSCAVSSGGGDCLYFRVQSATNWWRLRVRVYSSSYTYYTTTYEWAQQYTNGSPYPETNGWHILTSWSSSSTTAPSFPSSLYHNHYGYNSDWYSDDIDHTHSKSGSPYKTGNTQQTANTSYSTSYVVYLEKMVNGTQSTVATYTQSATSLRVVAQGATITPYINGSAKTAVVDAALETATYHGVGRGTSDYNGTALDNFSLTTFNEAPYAPTLTAPINSEVLNSGITQRFSWAFNDPDPGDSQSAYEVRYKPTASSTWTTVTGTSPNRYHDFAAGTFTAGTAYEWQAATKDSSGTLGPYSSSAFFSAGAAPAGPTITSPTNNSTVAETHTVTWTAAQQDSYQVQLIDSDGVTVVTDTGEVGAASTRQYTLSFDTPQAWTIKVRVKFDLVWSDWASVNITSAFTPPAMPTFLLNPSDSLGALLVEITNPTPTGSQPVVTHNEIWINDGTGYERRAEALTPNQSWVYWTPISGRDYTPHVYVMTYGANGTSIRAYAPIVIDVNCAVETDTALSVTVT